VPLQLDVRAAGKDAADRMEDLLGVADPAALQRLREGPFVTAGKAVQSPRVLLDQLPREARLAFRPVRRPRRDELAEVLVTLAALDEEGEAGGAGVLGAEC
jgi:hypothetical protein